VCESVRDGRGHHSLHDAGDAVRDAGEGGDAFEHHVDGVDERVGFRVSRVGGCGLERASGADVVVCVSGGFADGSVRDVCVAADECGVDVARDRGVEHRAVVVFQREQAERGEDGGVVDFLCGADGVVFDDAGEVGAEEAGGGLRFAIRFAGWVAEG